MAKKTANISPLTDEDRDYLVRKCIESNVPLSAADVAKANVTSRKVTSNEVVPILDEGVATARLHVWPAKTAKGQPRYWGRDAASALHDAVLDASRELEIPLTAKEMIRKISAPVKVTEEQLVPVLDSLIAGTWLFKIPATTKKGKVRYWNHDQTEFGRLVVKHSLAEKGPQSEAGLKKLVGWLSADQFRELQVQMVASGEIRRHPPLGKHIMFGIQPPRAQLYLQDVQSQLAKVVASLIAANVSPEELRRAAVQMVEQAGISFAAAGMSQREVSTAVTEPTIDLISVMQQIEPGAIRGALVGARDLRRVVKLEKSEFDRWVLDLSQKGRLSLHRHDYPASLSQTERDELVTDGSGTYFVGIALRQNS